MTESRFDANDPRLTAYVLGELDETERADVEQQLEECAQSRDAVAEIRNVAGLLSEQLPTEPTPALTEAQRETVVAESERVAVAGKTTPSRRGYRWVLVTAVSTIAAAGLLVALSPDLRDEIQSAAKYASFADYDDDDIDESLAFNEIPEGQLHPNDTWNGGLAQTEDTEGYSEESRTRMVRSSQPGEKSDLSSVDDLKVIADQSGFGSPGGDPAKQFSNKASRTNSESLAGNEQSIQSGRFSYGASVAGGAMPENSSAGKFSATPASRLGTINQPADATSASTPRVIPLYEERFDRNAKSESALGLIPAAPNASDSTRSRNVELNVKPAFIVESEEKLNQLNVRFKKRDYGFGGKTAPGSSTTTNGLQSTTFGSGLMRGGAKLTDTKGFYDLGIRNGVVTKRRVLVGGSGVKNQTITSPLPPRIVGGWGGEPSRRGLANKRLASKEGEELDRFLTEYLEQQAGGEVYAPIIENEFLSPLKEPLSTFGIDVDTAAYSNVRRFLNQGKLPPPNAVRIEELVNYFHYNEPEPAGDDPFSVSLEAADCPWNPGHRLVRIGIKGKEIDRSQRPSSNLVFLIDVSGSMKNANKLPLVRTALEMLTQQMTEDDRIAIVTYSNEATLELESTDGQNKDTILKAIRGLKAKGSTNGEAGIQLAYAKAVEHRIKDGANRVILCTDGDFNVGVSDDDELTQMVHRYADQSGVFLSIFGFGMGNLKDAKLEKLADKGNGHYGYIDNKEEAHKVFVEEMTGTLYTIAKDLKLQLEFNPYQVGAYRLIGYENRLMAAEDFDNDRKDAGDVGAGHSVTALFEIIPIDKLRQPVELKYQRVSRGNLDATDVVGKQADPNNQADPNSELLTLFLRYKQPDGKTSVKREYPLTDIANDSASATPSENLQWSAAVAAFGMVVRDSQYRGHANFDLARELALSAQGKDESGRRKEFLELVKKAQTIHSKLSALKAPAAKKESPQPEQYDPEPAPDKPASPKPDSPRPVEIGKNVQYWKTHKTNGNDAPKVIQVLKVLFPKIKTTPGANPGEVNIFARKVHHDKLADLIPRMTLD